jgi:hypothetical protein
MAMSALAEANGLRAVIEQAGGSLKDYTVLSTQVDPYRLDTAANHVVGKWFAEQMERLRLLHRRLHLRGVHYALLGSTAMPTGEPYQNTGECWEWLQNEAAKAARWLGYVPFHAITDARNAAPVIRPIESRSELPPQPWISVGLDVTVPDALDLEPWVYVDPFEVRQPYRLAFYGEKTSLEPILEPAALHFQADLFLPTGEISDTQMHLMASAAAEDGRSLIVFVIADFDPAGNQMAVSIGRKLQALRDLLFPELEFRLYPIALTADQVREFDLPSTPLKATEKRADRWRAEHGGLEQTEIDALATLQPRLLRRIVDQAVAPFYDRTLSNRAAQATNEWRNACQVAVDEQTDQDHLDELAARANAALESVREQIEELQRQVRIDTSDYDLPERPDIPEPEIDESLQPQPLVSTDWSWAEQTRALIARKRYGNGGAP